MSPKQRDESSLQIANKLLEIPIWEQELYHLFLPIEKQMEVDTSYILQILHGKDKQVAISKSNFTNQTLSHFLLTDNTILKNNKYGIPEPQNGLPLQEQQIDVVFVPLLAYDINGNRIGYGKGFYDRFLEKCRKNVIAIGVSFFEPENDLSSWMSKNDMPLQYIVSPNRVCKV